VIRFVDFEASSLQPGSYPIEVAWVDENGQGESYLIHPAPEWLSYGDPYWSAESQRVHGIDQQALVREGMPYRAVAKWAVRALASPGTMACSDQPLSDGMWLARLLSAAGLDVVVRLQDVMEAYAIACRPLLRLLPPTDSAERADAEAHVRALAVKIIADCEHAETLRPGTRHRALPDAMAHWRTWRAVRAAAATEAAAAEVQT
jgi:hypothetical protein